MSNSVVSYLKGTILCGVGKIRKNTQNLVSRMYSSVTYFRTLLSGTWLRHTKWTRNGVWLDCSYSRYLQNHTFYFFLQVLRQFDQIAMWCFTPFYFTWLRFLLFLGLLHIEMNAVKSFVEWNWDVFLQKIAYDLGFETMPAQKLVSNLDFFCVNEWPCRFFFLHLCLDDPIV